jgi:tRNA dimethylallyltransferase
VTAAALSEKPIIAIVGPTASGKSELGIALALRFGGEIINCDSVQVYREVEIATAKVPFEERRGIKHHLIDFVPLEVNYTAGDWARDAAIKIDEIEARGSLALIVGGTGFYLRALRQPFFRTEPTDASLRERLTSLRERRGAAHLHRMLTRVDAASAHKLFPNDWPRVQRALEVRFQTGSRMSEASHTRPAPPACAARIKVLALSPPRQELYRRINERTEAHFRAGLLEEVRGLLQRGAPRSSTALGAHGYRRVVEYIHGERSLESALEQTKLDIRHYAKRQLTWFRQEAGVEWFNGFGEEPEIQSKVATRVEELLNVG